MYRPMTRPLFFLFGEAMIARRAPAAKRDSSRLSAGLGRRSAKLPPRGEVAERSKAHAWKVCIRQKRIAGSNPALSATRPRNPHHGGRLPHTFQASFRVRLAVQSCRRASIASMREAR